MMGTCRKVAPVAQKHHIPHPTPPHPIPAHTNHTKWRNVYERCTATNAHDRKHEAPATRNQHLSISTCIMDTTTNAQTPEPRALRQAKGLRQFLAEARGASRRTHEHKLRRSGHVSVCRFEHEDSNSNRAHSNMPTDAAFASTKLSQPLVECDCLLRALHEQTPRE